MTKKKTTKKTTTRRARQGASVGDVVVDLESSIAIADVKQLAGKLRGLPKESRDVVLDASRVDAVDTAGLQLLVAFVRDTASQGVNVSWREPPEALCHAAACLDLEGPLRLGPSARSD